MANNSGKAKTGNREHRFAIASSEIFCNGLGLARIRKENVRPLDQGVDYCSNSKRPKSSNLNKTNKQPEKGFSGKSFHNKWLDTFATFYSSATVEEMTTDEYEVATNIKKFLGHGLLDGVMVTCYRQKPDSRKHSDVGTSGKILCGQIQCLCQPCHGIKYYTATNFEVHAGCKKKHPAENFYFDNGKTVRDVMNECKVLPFKFWGTIIHKLLADLSVPKSLSVCMSCKENTGGETTLCNLCLSGEKSARSMSNISSSTSSDGVSSTRPSQEQKLPKDKWFCDTVCKNIQSALQKLIEEGEICLPQYLVDRLQKKQEGKYSVPNNIDAKWRLLRGKISDGETKNLLSKAVGIFHDRFLKIKDGNSVDLIPRMVYGRSTEDMDFSGMYCAILSVKSTVVCAGIIQIFGDDVAELPLIAVQTKFQGKGYFHALFSCIEDLLASLNVKKLVLPAAEKVESMWVNKFGFQKVAQDELMKYEDDYPITRFKGSPMLHRPIVHHIW